MYETQSVIVALTSKARTFNSPEHDNMAAEYEIINFLIMYFEMDHCSANILKTRFFKWISFLLLKGLAELSNLTLCKDSNSQSDTQNFYEGISIKTLHCFDNKKNSRW